MPSRSASPIAFVPPMLPSLVDKPPEGDAWLHEVKYDGYRTQLVRSGKAVQAFTRNGYDWTERYGPVIRSMLELRCRSAIIDGEICVQNAAGVTDFGGLRRAIDRQPERLVLFAFDLLHLDGRELRGETLLDRRRRLQDPVSGVPGSRIQFSEHHVGEGPAFFRAAERHNLEGIVSKRADSRYVSGRAAAWTKTKSFAVGDFQVLGVERSSTGIPVALLATTGDDPAYVGDAMLTLKAKERHQFWADVERLGTPQARLKGALAKRKASWLKEGLVARVRHLRGEEKLRHATVQTVGRSGDEPGDVGPRHPRDE